MRGANNRVESTARIALRVLVDRMIHRLEVEGIVDGFSDEEISRILDATRDVLKPVPAMIELEAPLAICGDIHGQFEGLLMIMCEVGRIEENSMLFLGDYVDRGPNSLETALLLFCYKLKYSDRIHLLRGNHEIEEVNGVYGFEEECLRKRTADIFHHFQTVFNELPICARVSQRILCMHGGLSSHIKGWESLYFLEKPRNPGECTEGIVLDLLWADPKGPKDSCEPGYQFNEIRNTSVVFGDDVINDFCKRLNLDLIVRAHEVKQSGYEFKANNKLCTVFSAPNYAGTDGNIGAVMLLSKELEISFLTFEPELGDDENGNEYEEDPNERTPRPDSQIIPYDIIQATSEETVVSETSTTAKEMNEDVNSELHSDAFDGHWTNKNT